MTSLHAFSDGSVDYKQTYDIKDKCGPLPYSVLYPNTVLSLLALKSHPFLNVLLSVPARAALFNNTNFEFTLFVPQVIPYLDQYLQFIDRHCIDKHVPYPFLLSSSRLLLNTRNPHEKIIVENGILNGRSRIMSQENIGKYTVYFIDYPL